MSLEGFRNHAGTQPQTFVVLQVDLISRADAKRIQAFIKALNPASQILLTRNSEVQSLSRSFRPPIQASRLQPPILRDPQSM